MTALLRFENVTLERGGRRLIQDLNLAIGPGEALALTGPNGSGKSSLLRLAAGLLSPSAGSVERAQFALADDKSALDRELPLGEALRFWTGQDAGSVLMEFGISHLAAVPVRLLSSGQLKRAAIARVATSLAPLWLLDEPTNALDADGQDRLARLIDRHRDNGGAVVVATHTQLPGRWRTLELGR